MTKMCMHSLVWMLEGRLCMNGHQKQCCSYGTCGCLGALWYFVVLSLSKNRCQRARFDLRCQMVLKLMLAIKYDKHDTIGQDCVAMLTIIAAVSPFTSLTITQLVKMNQLGRWWLKVVRASWCCLIGGETAESLPGICMEKTTMIWQVSR